MSYANIRDGLVSTLEGVERYHGMVWHNDYHILNAGVEKAIVIRFQGMRSQRANFGNDFWRDWSFRLEVFTMVSDDIEQARSRQDADRDAIADALDSAPELGSVSEVFNAELNNIQTEDVVRSIGNYNFLVERYIVNVREEA